MEYSDFKNKHFAWVGQMATTGTPHPVTGRSSNYGRYFGFASKAERDEYVADFYDPNMNENAYPCTAKTGRQYSLGCSVQVYLEDLFYCPRLVKDSSGNWE